MTDQAPNAAAPYYQRHIFFCLNHRDNGQAACAEHAANDAFAHCKAQVKALGLAGQGKVRVNKAGCLDRCAGGPVAVVYPEGTWYTYIDTQDIDDIVQQHLRDGQVVQRLLLAQRSVASAPWPAAPSTPCWLGLPALWPWPWTAQPVRPAAWPW